MKWRYRKIRILSFFIIVGAVSNIFVSEAATIYTLDSVRQIVKGLYVMGYQVGITQSQADNSNIDGLHIRSVWSAIEPTEGNYDWSYLDAEIEKARSRGKKASLSIAAGRYTPSWVYDAGAQKFIYTEDNPYRKGIFCTDVTITIPFDPIYLQKWKNFIKAFGARYNNNEAVRYIRISGINEATAEIILPHELGGAAIENCDKLTSYDVQNWINAGYTQTVIKNTWIEIVRALQDAFPDKAFTASIGRRSLPAINDLGKYDKSVSEMLMRDFHSLAKTYLGTAFIPSNHGLSAFYTEPNVAALAASSAISYQMLWWVTGDETYRMNNKIAGDPKTIFETAIKNGINAGVSYLEIYSQDVDNQDFQQILQEAHQQILSVPRIFKVATSTVSADSAIIQWNTYELADSMVEYGVSVIYGLLSPLNSTLTTDHSITLVNLIPNTIYNYRVKSKDISGNLSESLNFSFTTLKDAIPPNSPLGLKIL